MDAVSFHAMATAVNAHITQPRGIKHHITAFFGRPMFEADKGPMASVHSTVEKTTYGKFEFTQVKIDPKCQGQDHYSRVAEQVSYWHRDPAIIVGKYTTGQVAEDLKRDGTTEIAPYITTQRGRNRKGMPVLIDADHGKGA
jgi:hypothetical protein